MKSSLENSFRAKSFIWWYVFTLVFVTRLASGADSLQLFASEVVGKISDSTGILPVELIHPSSLASLPREQLEFLTALPWVTIFNKPDFYYEIKNFDDRDNVKGLHYPIKPTHEIRIYHKSWHPNTAALVIEVSKLDDKWYVVIPVVPEKIFSIMKESMKRYLDERDRLQANIGPDLRNELSIMMAKGEKYAAIETIEARFGVSSEAAILFLSTGAD